jgi:hypothetical protein
MISYNSMVIVENIVFYIIFLAILNRKGGYIKI